MTNLKLIKTYRYAEGKFFSTHGCEYSDPTKWNNVVDENKQERHTKVSVVAITDQNIDWIPIP